MLPLIYGLLFPQCQTEPPSIAVFLEMVYSGRYDITYLFISFMLNDWSLYRYNWETISRNVTLAQLLQSWRLLGSMTTTQFYQTGLALRQISHIPKVTFNSCWTQWLRESLKQWLDHRHIMNLAWSWEICRQEIRFLLEIQATNNHLGPINESAYKSRSKWQRHHLTCEDITFIYIKFQTNSQQHNAL